MEAFLINNAPREQQFTFNLLLTVSDGLFASQARLTVQITYTRRLVTPRFFVHRFELTLDVVKPVSSYLPLIDLDRAVMGGGDFIYTINLEPQRAIHRLVLDI